MTSTLTINDIYNRIPGYREVVDQLTVLSNVRRPTARANTPTAAATEDVLAVLSEGADAAAVATMVLPAAAEALAEVTAVEIAWGALGSAKVQLEERRRQCLEDGPDVVLSGLNEWLEDVVAEVLTLRPLDELSSKDAVISSGRTEDFKRVKALGSAYGSLRAEQMRTMKRQQGGDIDYPIVLVLPDPLDVFPQWPQWQRGMYDTQPPWPSLGRTSEASVGARGTDDRRPQLWAEVSSAEFMIWAVEHHIRLWVPTVAEVISAGEQLVTAFAAEDDDRRAQLGAPPRTGRPMTTIR